MIELNVLVIGRQEDAETEKLLSFLNQKEIPHAFQKTGEYFDAPLPACCIGKYQTHGIEESLERIEGFYKIARMQNEKQRLRN